MYDEDKKTSGHGGLNEQFDRSTKPTLSVDVEKYRSYLDGSDMSDAQKEEFLQSLWSIIVSFVELGYGVHPLQEVCGKDHETEADGPKAEFNRLGLSDAEDNETGHDMPARPEAK